MSRRVKGGLKNTKSGTLWSKEELAEVLNLYLSVPNIKIHESNPLIINLSAQIGRTPRSIEAQLLMFRNLDKFGFYGFRNMSKICKELWMEYINKSKI